MKITWLGQACFELVAGGITVVCDPYDPSVGYAVHPRRADIVTISHEHFDHNCVSWIEGNPMIVRGVGEHKAKGVHITGLPSFHDKEGGARRGPNTVFVIEADGIRVCHLGDIGHMPGKELLARIGRPDVLLIPVGGYYTIDASEAVKAAESIDARLTIPMHFNTGVKDTPVATADAFAQAVGAERAGGSSVDVDSGYSGPCSVVLEYLR